MNSRTADPGCSLLAVPDRAGDAIDSHSRSVDCLAAVFVAPALAPFNKQRLYVTIVWRPNSEEKEAVFQMSKSDSLSFAQSEFGHRPALERSGFRASERSLETSNVE